MFYILLDINNRENRCQHMDTKKQSPPTRSKEVNKGIHIFNK